MDSIDSACTPLKAKYDECFNRWFKDFLQGNDNHERSCGAVFKQYQKCVKVFRISTIISIHICNY